ncbi:unnamed protein product [Hymenolepis diminuta]|uniref:Uncharacterized protein n=1 Tax=Hymenolepis diminuta TaxID=6216 RepID=A0A564YGR6_HYMDI|nr:unnamed protein product [Hymenolepis diminuta]
MTEVVPARLASESIVYKQKFLLVSCLLDHQSRQICLLKRYEKGRCTLPRPELMHRPP